MMLKICFIFCFLLFLCPGSVKATDSCPNGDRGNINCDAGGLIDEQDLSILLSSWAPNGTVPHPADLNNSNTIDEADLSILLGNWNTTPTPRSTPSPEPSPEPGAYNRPPARNYVFYDHGATNHNANHPYGAPWGSIYVVPWRSIHTGAGQFNWSSIDNFLSGSESLNKSVFLKLNVAESQKPGTTPIPSSYQCPTGSGQRIFPLWADLTPEWIRSQVGGSYYIPLDGQEGRPLCREGGNNPNPAYCWGVAVMPKYDSALYKQALREIIFAMGARYNNDRRVAGIIFGQGTDNEFGNPSKSWGDCDINGVAARLGYTRTYKSDYVKAGRDNDYTDWYASAFPDKPVYHTVTSGGKTTVKIMMEQGYSNLGIHQASLAPDHNWYHTTANDGILDIVMPWVGRRPIGWENAFIVRDGSVRTAKQAAYNMMLTMLSTFPDFFDFVQGFCFNLEEECTWARQYYGRTPQNTNDVWIAFQETDYPLQGGQHIQFSGWLQDWEYGLELKSSKGYTIRRTKYGSYIDPGLLELFNLGVANGLNGQARRAGLNETILLEPRSGWKGISDGTAPNYEVAITFIDNSGHVKVEVGNDADGWSVHEWDRTNQVNWQVKTFNVDKKAKQIKITPTGGPLYLHMVKLSLRS